MYNSTNQVEYTKQICPVAAPPLSQAAFLCDEKDQHPGGLPAAMLIGLASGLGRQVHLCHVSLAAEIALTRAGKEPGARVTCEVTPHHLFVNEDGAQRLGP